MFNCRKAANVEALAAKIGCDPVMLRQTLEIYNIAARGERPDPFEKRVGEMAEIDAAPFYALDASVDSRFLPMSVMSVGGLRLTRQTAKSCPSQANP